MLPYLLELVLWLSLAVLFYTFAGYPLMLAAWARLAPRPVAKGRWAGPVAVVVVAHNEERRIQAKIDSCRAQDYPRASLRVVIASDGSTDGTNEIVARAGDDGVTLLPFATRRGKASCLVDAVAACSEPIIVFTDARQPLAVDAVRKLVDNFADPSVGAVSGELVFRTEEASGFARGVDAYWLYEKFIRRREAATGSVPGATGALYALRRELFSAIPPQTILDDVLIPMNVALQGKRVVFESGAVAWDTPSADIAAERRRKIRTLAGNFQLLRLRPALLDPRRNPIWLQFVSHKLLRLVAPPAMLAVLLANLGLVVAGGFRGFYAGLLVAQLAFYALALAGAVLTAVRQWRVARLPATFLLLNWFTVLGFIEFISNRQAHLWKSGPA